MEKREQDKKEQERLALKEKLEKQLGKRPKVDKKVDKGSEKQPTKPQEKASSQKDKVNTD